MLKLLFKMGDAMARQLTEVMMFFAVYDTVVALGVQYKYSNRELYSGPRIVVEYNTRIVRTYWGNSCRYFEQFSVPLRVPQD
jgi:hypothetical protein